MKQKVNKKSQVEINWRRRGKFTKPVVTGKNGGITMKGLNIKEYARCQKDTKIAIFNAQA